ncbi:MAG: hypothetical protein IPM54_03365 [Polyangiaceae bacterium]|nr:hypothetical protein [Polyangiaceae bacterium]
MAVLYSYNAEKDWINVEWFAIHESRIVAQYSVYAMGGAHTKTYQYNVTIRPSAPERALEIAL